MNILFLYGATQTFTNTVYEHVDSFAKYSRNKFYFCHQDQDQRFDVNLSRFDAVVMHYSVRLPYDQVPEPTAVALERYTGLKALFIQDEYDYTFRAWHWIKRLSFQLVFTVVPPEGIAKVYPPEEFPGVRFVSNLTGYVPDSQPSSESLLPTSSRKIVVGYRGRRLPIRYGQLGQDKIEIGRLFKRFCKSKHITHDIEWTEDARIYGPKWYEFLGSCRSTLGSESGSNVFDWDGTLAARIETFKRENRRATDDDAYQSIVRSQEIPGLMNQVSPRIFEALLLRTALVLYEGHYSGAVTPMQHYIPVKKDGSNLNEVVALLQNDRFIDDLTERAYQEIILSGEFSYRTFVRKIDDDLDTCRALLARERAMELLPCTMNSESDTFSPLTTRPVRALPIMLPWGSESTWLPVIGPLYRLYRLLPDETKVRIRSLNARRKHLLMRGKRFLLNGAYRAWKPLPDTLKNKVRRLLKHRPNGH